MTKLHTCYSSSAASSKLGNNKDSHVISKVKPKIRIIHIYAPEIIKTDAANFRELVQRLTGKPEEDDKRGGARSKSKAATSKDLLMDLHHKKKTMMVMQEDEKEFLSLQNGMKVKNENEEEEEDVEVEVEDHDIWRRSSKSNEKFSGFLDGFSELDGCFMEELGNTMPLVNQN